MSDVVQTNRQGHARSEPHWQTPSKVRNNTGVSKPSALESVPRVNAWGTMDAIVLSRVSSIVGVCDLMTF